MECSNRPCPNSAVVKGLCKPCYNYRHAKGLDRPLTKPPKKTHCANPACGKASDKLIKERCPSCYRYSRKKGKDRKPRVVNGQAMCTNCKKRYVYAKGRCVPCYYWYQRNGEERPADTQERRSGKRKCGNANCHKIIKHMRRCPACQKYWRIHGKERTKAMCDKKNYRYSKNEACKVCKSPKVVSKGRCGACSSYYRRNNGKARPRYLWDKSFPCKTCGIPLGTVKGRCVSGYCGACYSFVCDGKIRPRHLWGIGPHGWCSCGRPAFHQIGGTGKCAICKDAPLTTK